jgi:hypothetical protein
MVAPFARSRRVPIKQSSTLFRTQPISQADADAAHAFHAADACSKFRTEKAGVSSLVRDPTDCRETQVDRGRRVVSLLKVNAVAEDDGAIERQAGFRAVPRDELADGMVIGPLATGGT